MDYVARMYILNATYPHFYPEYLYTYPEYLYPVPIRKIVCIIQQSITSLSLLSSLSSLLSPLSSQLAIAAWSWSLCNPVHPTCLRLILLALVNSNSCNCQLLSICRFVIRIVCIANFGAHLSNISTYHYQLHLK